VVTLRVCSYPILGKRRRVKNHKKGSCLEKIGTFLGIIFKKQRLQGKKTLERSERLREDILRK
jgi:hypothetical protein